MHDLAQRMYELWRIVEPRAHLELRKAKLSREMAGLVIDLSQSLDVVGNKSDGDDTDLVSLFRRELPQRVRQRGLEPAAGADFALVAETVRVAPSAPFHDEPHGVFDLAWIGIAFFHYRYWNAVSAEKDFRLSWI